MTVQELAYEIAKGLVETGVEGGYGSVSRSTAGDYPSIGCSQWEGERANELLARIPDGDYYAHRSYSDICNSGDDLRGLRLKSSRRRDKRHSCSSSPRTVRHTSIRSNRLQRWTIRGVSSTLGFGVRHHTMLYGSSSNAVRRAVTICAACGRCTSCSGINMPRRLGAWSMHSGMPTARRQRISMSPPSI